MVLRTQRLGDSDRIVTLLTRHHGRVRAVAKGIRKTSSRYGARLEPFNHVDLQLYAGRNLDTITQVEAVHSYGIDFSQDYELWTSGQVLLETAEKLTPEERDPADQQFLLLISALRSLATHEHPSALVISAYLLRAVSIAGWQLTLDGCSTCGAVGEYSAFDIASGGSVCDRCKTADSRSQSISVIRLMQALISGDWHLAETTDLRTRREATSLISAYLRWHLERDLRSIRLVESRSGVQ